jgi:hypothetical protein
VEGRAGVKRTLAARSAHAKRDGAAGITITRGDGPGRAADRTSCASQVRLMPSWPAWHAEAQNERDTRI